MKLKYHIITLCAMVMVAFGALFFQGCTKEDNTECGIVVSFEYVKNVDLINKFNTNVKQIDLYIFDENGNWLETHSGQGSPTYLAQDYSMKLTHIKPGTYTLVAWGNVTDDYLSAPSPIRSSTYLNSILTIKHTEHEEVKTPSTSALFWGWSQQLVVGNVVGTQPVLIPLTKFTNHIVLTTTGLPVGNNPNPDNLPFNSYITSKNGSYRFNGSFANEEVITYYPTTVDPNSSNGTITSDYYILRELSVNAGQTDATDARLVITQGPQDTPTEILMDEPLVDLLMACKLSPRDPKNTGDLDVDDLYHLNVAFDFTGGNMTVKINDWTVVNKPNPLK